MWMTPAVFGSNPICTTETRLRGSMVNYHQVTLLQLVSHRVQCLALHCYLCTLMIYHNLSCLLTLYCSPMTILSMLLEPALMIYITAKFNTAMSRISFWISENGLRLNTQNTKSMLIHPPSKHPPPLVASCNNSLIEQVRTLNYLECLLTST